MPHCAPEILTGCCIAASARVHNTYALDPISCRELEEDTALLKARMARVASDSGVSILQVPDDYVEEMVRFGAAELHVMGAIMGGIAAQEIIKFITRQFVPVPGTLIYNAMASTSSVFVL